jgi:GNAT superfamily N-acetyltransferase
MRIREARIQDLPEILRLLRVLDAEAEMSVSEAKDIFERMDAYPHYRCYIAEEDDKPVGTFCMIICDNLGHAGRKFAVVENVVVDPFCQGQGIGQALMKAAMEEAAEHGCYKLMLSSNEKRTAAHRFYDNLGFARHGVSFRVEVDGPRHTEEDKG